jgi:ABC-type nitrate/sulfonate/bicarbonate transport system substrate-binding protein
LATSEIIRSFNLSTPLFHAGNQAIAAYPRWESVVIGPIPSIIGAVKYSAKNGGTTTPALKVVAVVSQDRLAHSLMIAKGKFDEIKADPATRLPGRKVLLTPASTAQMLAERCLASWGLALNQMTLIEGEQAEIRSKLADKEADVAFVWMPFTYLVEDDKAKAKALPCLDIDTLDLPAVIVARADLLMETDPVRLDANRKRIGKFVAEYLGAWAKAAKKPADAAKRLVKTYKDETIKISEAEAIKELEARQPPDLEGQRTAFKPPPGGGPAPLMVTLDAIMDFMAATGTLQISDRPAASDLIDPAILEAIASDSTLTAIALGEQ